MSDAPAVSIVTIQDKIVKHFWYPDRKTALAAARQKDAPGVDVYWGMATFNGHARKKDNVHSLSYFWLDIDCGAGKPYATQEEALEAVNGAGMPAPSMLVNSGNGLHVYWALHSPVPPAEWAPVAERLKRACVTRNLQADHMVTTDAARILRVPGTHNYKDANNPKPVTVMQTTPHKYTLADFAEHLPAVGPLRGVAPKLSAEWDIDAGEYPTAKLENVLRGCAQVLTAAKCKSDGISEPYWRAVLSVVYRCDNGEKLIHSISSGDPRYSPEETQRKAEATKGPATCEHFKAVRPEGCTGCPNNGAVKSPIAILPPAPIPAQDEDEETAPAARPTKVGDWHITAAGVYRVIEDDGDMQKVWAVRTPVYGDVYRTKQGEHDTDADDAKILLTWLRPDGVWRRTLMPLSLIGSGNKMMEWAGSQGLGTLIPNVKVWTMYISELTNDLLQRNAVQQYYSRLGWHAEDKQFVLGKQMVTADGLEKATVERHGPLAGLEPTGDLETWKAGVNLLNRPGLEQHMFCVLAGFGTPLLQLMDVSGAVVSLAGASGRGKTLAAKAALSIYGNPEQLFQAAEATKNSIDVHLATLHSVPYLMDEVTSLPDKKIGDLLYMIANGRGKDSLTRNRGWRDGGTWRMLAFFTTNRPIMESDQGTLTEAQRNRAIELVVNNAVPAPVAARIYAATSQNHGVAAVPFLQYVIANPDKVRAVCDAALERVKKEFRGPDAQRFGIWALAAALAGGLIAKKLGLVECDPVQIIRSIVPHLEQQAQETLAPEGLFVQVVQEWLTQESSRVTSSNGGALGYADDAIARIDGEVLYLHSSRLKAQLRERNVSQHILKEYLTTQGVAYVKARLSSGTPPVNCLCIPRGLIFIAEEGFPMAEDK